MKKANKLGRDFEKKWAKKSKSNVTIGSGNLWFDKEDCKNENWLFQNKATKNSKFVFKLTDIRSLSVNANKTKRDWAFVISFNESFVLENSCFVVVPLSYITKKTKYFKKYILYMEDKVYNKQMTLDKEVLEDCWIADKTYICKFVDFKEPLAVINEIDFLKAFEKNIF